MYWDPKDHLKFFNRSGPFGLADSSFAGAERMPSRWRAGDTREFSVDKGFTFSGLGNLKRVAFFEPRKK